MNIHVSENRQITLHGIGQIIGEHNATVLNFTFPEKIVGIDIDDLNKYLVFDLDGVSPQLIENNTFNLSSLYTKQTELVMQIKIMRGNDLLFKSEKFMLEFEEDIEVNYKTTVEDLDVINNLITQYQTLVANIETIKTNLETLETTIENAESLRSLVENARIVGEEIRVDNENVRIQNESSRQTTFNDLSTKMENAIKGIDDTINAKVVQKFNTMTFSINDKGELEVDLTNG